MLDTHTLPDTQTDMYKIDMQVVRQTDRPTGRQAGRPGRQAGRQIDRQMDRQTDRFQARRLISDWPSKKSDIHTDRQLKRRLHNRQQPRTTTLLSSLNRLIHSLDKRKMSALSIVKAFGWPCLSNSGYGIE